MGVAFGLAMSIMGRSCFSQGFFMHWDPSSNIVVIPYLNLPVTWYGLLFALGFWFGFHIFVYMYRRFLSEHPEFVEGDIRFEKWTSRIRGGLEGVKKGSIESCNRLLKKEVEGCQTLLEKRLYWEKKYPDLFIPIGERARLFAEKLVLYVVLATVVGARVAYILFYQNPMDYLMNPLSILKTWEGGLASHGGVTAIVLTLWFFHKKAKQVLKEFSFWDLLDHVAVPTMLVASMIRIGNFFNQEILGTTSTMPWAIVFGHPKDGSLPIARHPVQLYESLFYFSLFVTLAFLWYYKGKVFSRGRLAGIAIGGSFFFRFFIEYVKTEQSVWFDYTNSHLLMGQVLSIPMVVIGAILLLRNRTLKRSEGK